ncbi:MAG: CoA-binding protein [Candidatus Micrarchaeota archaeon]
MQKKVQNLKFIFEPRNIAIIGASEKPGKLGTIILKNLIDGSFAGKVYPVNPKHNKIFKQKCFSDVTKIKDRVDCAIIVTPAETVPAILNQCAKKKIPGVVLLTSGFAEAGRNDLEEEVRKIANKNNIAIIGANCLGVYNPYNRVDSVFLPMYKLERPRPGDISFITQSGGVGSTIIDTAAHYGVGIAKFVSYGNATNIDESDLLEYLEQDKKTKAIIAYIEGVKDGRRFFETIKRVNKKKPVIILKAGKHSKSAKAALSHTGNIAGSAMAYTAAFRQAKVIEAQNLEELFDFVRMFSQPLPNGNKIAIVTNGGGPGILATDNAEEIGLPLADFEEKSKLELKKILPDYGSVNNPLDLIAEADSSAYEKSIEILMQDKNVDAICIIMLPQTPAIDERILKVLIKASDDRRKPIAVVCIGGNYADSFRRYLEGSGVPAYAYPLQAIKAISKLAEYAKFRKRT